MNADTPPVVAVAHHPLASFEGICVALLCDPHNVTALRVEITVHRPEDESDGDHRRHHRPQSGCDIAISSEQMKHFVPGKKYRVTVTEV